MLTRFIIILFSTFYFGFISYSQGYKTIDSLIKLPPKIIYKLDKYLFFSIGNLRNDLVFKEGIIYDLDNYFENDSTIFNYLDSTEFCDFHPKPKYELWFDLKEQPLGINYNFTILLDNYGQLLNMEWPCSGYSKKEDFIPLSKLREFVVSYAKKKKYLIKDYSVRLKYNYEFKKMVWYFEFPQKTYKDQGVTGIYFQVIVIDAINLNILQDYNISSFIPLPYD